MVAACIGVTMLTSIYFFIFLLQTKNKEINAKQILYWLCEIRLGNGGNECCKLILKNRQFLYCRYSCQAQVNSI